MKCWRCEKKGTLDALTQLCPNCQKEWEVALEQVNKYDCKLREKALREVRTNFEKMRKGNHEG